MTIGNVRVRGRLHNPVTAQVPLGISAQNCAVPVL